MAVFSQELVNETIAVFKDKHGIDISPEQAEQYLQRLAGLFIAFAPKNIRGAVRS